MSSIPQSIIATLCYSDIFDYPLTEQEIFQNLISEKSVPEARLHQAISVLCNQQRIHQSGNYYLLPNRNKIIKVRAGRQKPSLSKEIKARSIAAAMVKLPFVRAVFLTGAVAVNNAPVNDDIDIMIVVAKQSLWTCRLFVSAWLDMHHLRRHPGDQSVSDKICPNLFLAEDALKIDGSLRNLYTAHEVVQTKPLADPDNLFESFLIQNKWVTKFLPNSTIPAKRQQIIPTRPAPHQVEKYARILQEWYMKSRKTREITSPDVAYFHPRDTGAMIQAAFLQRLKQYAA